MKTLKWYHLRCVRLTRDYVAGSIAGVGLGIVWMAWATDMHIIRPGFTWVVIPGMALISIGSCMMNYGKRSCADPAAQGDPQGDGNRSN